MSGSIGISRRGLMGLGLASATTALTACGGSKDSAQSGGKKISFLMLGPSQALIAHVKDTLIPAFTQASGISVELQTSDWGSAFQKVTTGAASNSLADVLIIGGIWTAPLAEKKVLLDLSDRVKNWSDKDKFYPAMFADGVYADKNYAVPVATDVRSGLYRKDLLEAAGHSSLPTTWDEFKEAAKAVKGKGGVVAPIDWGQDKSIGLQQAFAQLFLQAGGQYWVDGKASFASDQGMKALTFMVDTFKEGLADPNMVYSGSGPRAVISGQATQTLSGVAVLQNASETAKDVEDKIVVGPGLKADASGRPTSVAWINKVAIAANSKNPDQAWEFVKFLASADQLGEVSRLYGALPPRSDLADASWINAGRKQILATAADAVSQPPNPVMMQLGPAVKTLLEPAIRGEVSVPDTLKAIDDKVNSLKA